MVNRKYIMRIVIRDAINNRICIVHIRMIAWNIRGWFVFFLPYSKQSTLPFWMPMKLFDSFGNTFVRSTEQEKSCVYFTVNQRVDTNLLAQINVMPAVIRIEEKKRKEQKRKK